MAAVWDRSNNGLRIRLRVQPRSSRNRISGVHGQALKVSVTAPPVEGAANAAVVALLADVLAVPRRCITIVAGLAGRDKQVLIATDDSEPLIARLEAAITCVDKARVGD